MIIRPARLTDFAHLETFVWQAIFPAFDVPGLSESQRAENDALVERARDEVAEVLGREYYAVYVAIEPKSRSLAGYIIVDGRPAAYAEILRLIVKRAYRGKGVGELLLDEATNFIGRDRAVSLAVRHYNARAIAFFSKHGFIDTQERTGNHEIPRTLMLREANIVNASKPVNQAAETDISFGADFPSAADEPIFEALPDYTLATDETPLFETGANALRTEEPDDSVFEDTTLSDEQLTVLESFIAKARAKKGIEKSSDDSGSKSPRKPAKPKPAIFDRSAIAFEVDYGAGLDPESSTPPTPKSPATAGSPKPSFAFDFAPVSEEVPRETVMAPLSPKSPTGPVATKSLTEPAATKVSPTKAAVEQVKSTKVCVDCQTSLPSAARFCFVCGLPQTPVDDPQPKAPDDVLELAELPKEPDNSRQAPAEKIALNEQPAQPAVRDKTPRVTASELRKAFRDHLEDRVTAYFGNRMLPKFLGRLAEDIPFQQVRDGSLASLVSWLNDQPAAEVAKLRKHNTFADLTEYFIVETAADLSNNILPQRLLRHQSVNWQTADLFKLVMDYLEFAAETETVHTDFVSMPARALKNATKSFLHGAKDERVFFICDQSLISQAKHGFAITDSGIYWKNVLQPAGAATFTTMKPLRLEQGHLVIDGQFFDAGGRLNLKVAILLDKLRRMR